MNTQHNDRIYLNPRIDSESKKKFEKNVFEQKQKGVKIDMSKLFRAFVDAFNEDPDGIVKQLKLTK